jgi:tRNA-dihydrouridine synthase B
MSVFPSEFQIGATRLAPATVLAPMAGVTDTVFRRLIRNQGGCGLIMTEFTSSHGVVASLKGNELKAKKGSLNFSLPVCSSRRSIPSRRNCFGSDPQVMADAALRRARILDSISSTSTLAARSTRW